jgi:hypothetical protein
MYAFTNGQIMETTDQPTACLLLLRSQISSMIDEETA